jgi:hypothetical protein
MINPLNPTNDYMTHFDLLYKECEDEFDGDINDLWTFPALVKVEHKSRGRAERRREYKKRFNYRLSLRRNCCRWKNWSDEEDREDLIDWARKHKFIWYRDSDERGKHGPDKYEWLVWEKKYNSLEKVKANYNAGDPWWGEELGGELGWGYAEDCYEDSYIDNEETTPCDLCGLSHERFWTWLHIDGDAPCNRCQLFNY